jgi:hypothetical protein
VASLLGRCHLECSGHVISDLSWFTVRVAEVGASTAYAPGDEVLQGVNALEGRHPPGCPGALKIYAGAQSVSKRKASVFSARTGLPPSPLRLLRCRPRRRGARRDPAAARPPQALSNSRRRRSDNALSVCSRTTRLVDSEVRVPYATPCSSPVAAVLDLAWSGGRSADTTSGRPQRTLPRWRMVLARFAQPTPPCRCKRCESSVPAGPPPSIPTCVRISPRFPSGAAQTDSRASDYPPVAPHAASSGIHSACGSLEPRNDRFGSNSRR